MAIKPMEKKETSWAHTSGVGERTGPWGTSGFIGDVFSMIGTLSLLTLAPLAVMILASCIVHFHGNFGETLNAIYKVYEKRGLLAGIQLVWPSPFNREAWRIILSFGLTQALLQLYVPGKVFKGGVTPKGNVPVYKANGVQRWFVWMVLFSTATYMRWIHPERVYDLYPEIVSALNFTSILICVGLTLKGYYLPSSTDSGTTGSLIHDFYWGTELYPRIGKNFDIKEFTNCSFGMMWWATMGLCSAWKQYVTLGHVTNSMLVSVALLEIYLFKFFLWETGYWCSMDIQHDRAGFYICWGCLVWVTSLYCSPQLFLAEHPVTWSNFGALAILIIGTLSIWMNYDSDRQRQEFRAKNGKINIWGKPAEMVIAKYRTSSGEEKSSLLLSSGWWGISRHFHYLPEWGSALCWSLPAGFTHIVPYLYFIFLLLLLTDRAFRDDKRCAGKYGKYWDEYCKRVPFKIIPGIL